MTAPALPARHLRGHSDNRGQISVDGEWGSKKATSSLHRPVRITVAISRRPVQTATNGLTGRPSAHRAGLTGKAHVTETNSEQEVEDDV